VRKKRERKGFIGLVVATNGRIPMPAKAFARSAAAIVQSGDANPASLVMRFSILDDVSALQSMLSI